MVVSPLDRKLLRDLTTLRGQVMTIALVICCGVASYISLQSAYSSLISSRDRYYEQQRFGDVFAHLERAPASLARRIRSIRGVATTETRIVDAATILLDTLREPIRGTVLSIPSHGTASLNAIHLRQGHRPDPARPDEILLLEAFAEANGLSPGDTLVVVMKGTLRELRIAGIAMSPEFVLTLGPGEIAFDAKRSAVLWMPRPSAEAAFQMEGAFNDVSLKLQPGASEAAAKEELDRLLGPYGGLGAMSREKQTSNYMLSGELQQLEKFATTMPLIFLLVASFLVNVVLTRLVTLQRPQIATLKAIGYSNSAIAAHYFKLVAVIGVLGAIAGVSLGAYLGSSLFDVYTGKFFRFPSPSYDIEWSALLVAIGTSVGAAVAGALLAVRGVVRLAPAEAMRPPAPGTYRQSLQYAGRIVQALGTLIRIGLRELERRPWRSVFSALGIAMAVAILVMGRFMYDAIRQLLYTHFERSMREDVTVTFEHPLPQRAVRSLAHLPGVLRAEGLRTAPVELRSRHRMRDVTLVGYPRDGELRRLIDREGRPRNVLEHQALLTTTLASILHVSPGETVRMKLREGDHRTMDVRVGGTVDESFGLQVHLPLPELQRLLDETPLVNVALLRVDIEARAEVLRRLKDTPAVLSVGSPDRFEEQFEAQSGSTMKVITLVLTLFASAVAMGIVYNNARVALSARARDLASLRVLGFTRGEVATVLFTELAVQVVVAIPIGLVIGRWMSGALMSTADPEAYRFPIVVSSQTYAFAAVVTVAAAVASALLVRRKLDRLDLIAVMKTRE